MRLCGLSWFCLTDVLLNAEGNKTRQGRDNILPVGDSYSQATVNGRTVVCLHM